MRQFLCFNVIILIFTLTCCGQISCASKDYYKNETEIEEDAPSKISLNISFDDQISTKSVTKGAQLLTSSVITTKTTRSSSSRKPSKKRPTSTTNIPKAISTKSGRKNETNEQYECPKDNEVPFQLFYTQCNSNKECKNLGPSQICCKLFGSKRCIEGKVVQPKEPKHEPILFVIPRKCPKPGQLLAETWWNIETCESDNDCWPRICCPDGKLKYCRTSQPEFESASIPAARQLATPLESVAQYLQCTPAPPPVFDPHPKPCNNTLDCFPNLCCAEAGKKVCRPPKRSILSLLTGFAQGFSNVSFIRDWTENLIIR
uniref:CSON009764 protein n=1 Tax=Culicoides sonorensis TaxID=179676 RepID=A0A336M4K3_CULSO